MSPPVINPLAEAAGISRGRYLKRVAIIAAICLLLVFGGGVLIVAPFLFEPNRFAQVQSIEHDTSYRNPALMRAAWQLPVAASYARQPYEFQHNQSFCGPTSVANVLHSLGIPLPQERILDHSPYHSWFGYLLGGLTLDQLADLLRQRSGRPTTILRNLTLNQFRAEMRMINDPDRRYIANFNRGPLFGRGHGHFSPLLGYLADRDLVLVGDVNAGYRPFLVPTDRLWMAVNTIDEATGQSRGLVVLTVPDTSNLPARKRNG